MTTFKIPQGLNWLPVYLYLLVLFYLCCIQIMCYIRITIKAFSIKHTKNVYKVNDFDFLLMNCSLVLT